MTVSSQQVRLNNIVIRRLNLFWDFEHEKDTFAALETSRRLITGLPVAHNGVKYVGYFTVLQGDIVSPHYRKYPFSIIPPQCISLWNHYAIILRHDRHALHSPIKNALSPCVRSVD